MTGIGFHHGLRCFRDLFQHTGNIIFRPMAGHLWKTILFLSVNWRGGGSGVWMRRMQQTRAMCVGSSTILPRVSAKQNKLFIWVRQESWSGCFFLLTGFHLMGCSHSEFWYVGVEILVTWVLTTCRYKSLYHKVKRDGTTKIAQRIKSRSKNLHYTHTHTHTHTHTRIYVWV